MVQTTTIAETMVNILRVYSELVNEKWHGLERDVRSDLSIQLLSFIDFDVIIIQIDRLIPQFSRVHLEYFSPQCYFPDFQISDLLNTSSGSLLVFTNFSCVLYTSTSAR